MRMSENTHSVLARKYRPKYFAEIMGQSHVVTVLRNALHLKKVAHAYLFSGPRGVGKTTIARLLAKALNCENQGEGNIPCGACTHCTEIDKEASYVYCEIDGASHRGIDQMRKIQEELSYSTVSNLWRVYVIDEVHMLTNEAFNAMLKSLEEPPEKIVFVLCTTESYRVPMTIVSRTQHFRFCLFSIEEIEEVLAQIFEKEGVIFDRGALFYIAKRANGSMRDAENIAEQVLAYCLAKDNKKVKGYEGITVNEQKTLEALQILPEDILIGFFHRIAAQDLRANVLALSELLAKGYQLVDFFYDFISFISNFLLYKINVQQVSVLKINQSYLSHFKENCDLFSERDLHLMLDITFDFLKELRWTRDVEICAKLFLHKIHCYKSMISPEELRQSLLSLAENVAEEDLQSSVSSNNVSSSDRSLSRVSTSVQKTTPTSVVTAKKSSHQSTKIDESTSESVKDDAQMQKIGQDMVESAEIVPPKAENIVKDVVDEKEKRQEHVDKKDFRTIVFDQGILLEKGKE